MAKTEAVKAVAPDAKKIVTQYVDIRLITSNAPNQRSSLPTLLALGHGIFERLEGSDKPSLRELCFSDNPEMKAEFKHLIEKYESSDDDMEEGDDKDGKGKKRSGGIVGLAGSLTAHGWIQPGELTELSDGNYELVAGCRRTVAAMYNYVLWGLPDCKGRYQIVILKDENQARARSFHENLFRKNMNPVEQARAFQTMRNNGQDINKIAEQTGINHQTVRGRLALLKHLSSEDLDKVESGDMPYHKALKLANAKKDAKANGGTPVTPTPTSRAVTNSNVQGRRKAPTLKEMENFYRTREDLHEEVRKWIAVEILGEDYKTYKQLKKELAAAAAAS